MPPCTAFGRDKIGAMQHIQPKRRQLNAERPGFPAMMGWCLQTRPFRAWHEQRGLAPVLQHNIFLLIRAHDDQRPRQFARVSAYATLTIGMQASVNANSHTPHYTARSTAARCYNQRARISPNRPSANSAASAALTTS